MRVLIIVRNLILNYVMLITSPVWIIPLFISVIIRDKDVDFLVGKKSMWS